LFKL
ncbi:hypothetical protein AVEN_238227-1, partial [Araneus ventricosus]